MIRDMERNLTTGRILRLRTPVVCVPALPTAAMEMAEESDMEAIVMTNKSGSKNQLRMHSKNSLDTSHAAMSTPTSKKEGIRTNGMRIIKDCQSWMAMLVVA